MPTIPDILAKAVQHHQAGGFLEAEQGYRHILQLDPAEVNALHLLGVLCQQQGHPDRGAGVGGATVYPRLALAAGSGDSPWYPTMCLYRQTEPGNWTGVFERLAAEVKRLL